MKAITILSCAASALSLALWLHQSNVQLDLEQRVAGHRAEMAKDDAIIAAAQGNKNVTAIAKDDFKAHHLEILDISPQLDAARVHSGELKTAFIGCLCILAISTALIYLPLGRRHSMSWANSNIS